MTTVTDLASRCAAPQAIPQDLELIQLHAEAHNALSMALHYVRQPAANIPGAARKAVQALAALGRLQDLGGVHVATSASGRA